MKITDPRRLVFPGLKVKPRLAERASLANGIPAHLMEDRGIPVVSFGAIFRTGSICDPDDKVGLAGMTASSMRLGGSALLQGDELDEELDYLGAALDVGVDDDSFFIEAWCLKRHLPRIMELAADVIKNPAFPEEKVELARSRELEGIRRRWDQPAGTANLMFRRQIYGKDSPWGRIGDASMTSGITREDIVAFHETRLVPGAMVMAAAGDFRKDEIMRLLDTHLGSWRAAAPKTSSPEPVKVAFPGGVYLVPREVGQANFRIGHLGTRIQDPDHFALRLMDMILGNGAFTTRLFRDIRTERGLAYAVWSRMSPRHLDVGTFHVGGETKFESVGEALGAILGHIKDLQKKDVTREEIRLAKETLDNSFAFEFQSTWDIAWRQAEYEYSGLPADWMFTERKSILAATVSDVKRAARKHLHPERTTILVVGDPLKCRSELEKFGPVTELPVPE